MNNFYDNCKQIADFELTLNIFFTNLSKKLPEFDHDIKKALKHFNKSDKTEYITKLIKNMEPHIDYIAKYDDVGDVLWAKSAGGTNGDFSNNVSTDNNGNVYITGNFRSPTITFGTTTLAKVDNTGNYPDVFAAAFY